MTRADDWLQPQRHSVPTAATRAGSVWVWINQHASSLQVDRSGSLQAAQTVRVEGSGANEVGSETGRAAKRRVIVFGVQGHSSIADTDLRRGDRFSYNASPAGRLNYEIIHVDK